MGEMLMQIGEEMSEIILATEANMREVKSENKSCKPTKSVL